MRVLRAIWKWLLTHRAFALVILLAFIGLLAWSAFVFIRRPAITPFMRGERIAYRMGCFNCHGPEGLIGYTNPGSFWGETPPLKAGGVVMSFVHDTEELREWILYGLPKRLWPNGVKPAGDDLHRYTDSRSKNLGVDGLIQMPGYAGLISERELNDLVEYIQVINGGFKPLPEDAARGYKIAEKNGCFGCHGVDGRGGAPNPRSFKGYIPPWQGHDYAEMVLNDGELREWILKGEIERFERHPVARIFTHRQQVQMPGFKEVLSKQEVDDLVAYIHWLNDPARQTKPNWVEEEVPSRSNVIARGKWLYEHTGCVSCHMPEGKGGLPNPNAVGGYVPNLNVLAEQLEIFEPEDLEKILAVFQKGLRLDDPSVKLDVPYFESIQDQYIIIRNLILRGNTPSKRAQEKPEPPIVMPSWSKRMYATDMPLDISDVDAIIAYLLSLQDFSFEEDW